MKQAGQQGTFLVSFPILTAWLLRGQFFKASVASAQGQLSRKVAGVGAAILHIQRRTLRRSALPTLGTAQMLGFPKHPKCS